MKRMAAGEFKTQCLAVMDQVLQSGEPVLITKHGKPVAKLVPAESSVDDIFGYMAGRVKTIRNARQNSGIAVADITLWELAWLAQNGRIVVAGSVESFLRETVARVILKPVTPEIVALGVRLPPEFPKDPADRMIAATAMVEGMPLVTADTHIRRSKAVETIW
jgi:prevent-host-death family protein